MHEVSHGCYNLHCCDYFLVSVQGSTIALARWPDACFEGVGPPVFIFYWLDGPLVSTSYNGIIHHCFR